VVNGFRGMLTRVEQTLPPHLHIQPIADQSISVKAAVAGVIREAVIAACLTAMMILLFLGSWRYLFVPLAEAVVFAMLAS
jgi:multidrug efflux pump subunit AcrB